MINVIFNIYVIVFMLCCSFYLFGFKQRSIQIIHRCIICIFIIKIGRNLFIIRRTVADLQIITLAPKLLSIEFIIYVFIVLRNVAFIYICCLIKKTAIIHFINATNFCLITLIAHILYTTKIVDSTPVNPLLVLILKLSDLL
jgi:hypothetical protein